MLGEDVRAEAGKPGESLTLSLGFVNQATQILSLCLYHNDPGNSVNICIGIKEEGKYGIWESELAINLVWG